MTGISQLISAGIKVIGYVPTTSTALETLPRCRRT